MNICRDCEGFEEDRIMVRNLHWVCNEKMDCPLNSITIKPNYLTKDDIFIAFKRYCANEKIIALYEPGEIEL